MVSAIDSLPILDPNYFLRSNNERLSSVQHPSQSIAPLLSLEIL
jgi:hypothetical protein